MVSVRFWGSTCGHEAHAFFDFDTDSRTTNRPGLSPSSSRWVTVTSSFTFKSRRWPVVGFAGGEGGDFRVFGNAELQIFPHAAFVDGHQDAAVGAVDVFDDAVIGDGPGHRNHQPGFSTVVRVLFDFDTVAGFQFAGHDVLVGVGQKDPRIIAERDLLGERAVEVFDFELVLLGENFHHQPHELVAAVPAVLSRR